MFEEVYKRALDEYEQMKFESDIPPPSILNKFRPEKKRGKNGN